MNVAKKILIVILILMLLASGVIVACIVNPNLSGKLADILYGEDVKPSQTDENEQSDIGSLISSDGMSLDEADDGEEAPDVDWHDDAVEDAVGDKDEIESDMPEDTSVPDDSVIDTTPASDYPFTSDPYVAPDVSQIVIPPEVSGKSGMEEPKATVLEVDDPRADEIEEELGPGLTGEGLDFDAMYYPYYHMLDDNGKKLYRQIYANADGVNRRFAPVTSCTSAELKKVMEAVFNDHPELFWLNTAYNAMRRRNGQIAEIDLDFNSLINNLDEAKSKFDSRVQEIINGAGGLTSDYDKEKYVHDELCDNITYSLSAPMNQSAYSAIVNGNTVCAGYARAMQYLMRKLGVPCYYCTGVAGENHAWDIIRLDGEYYNVDATWDDADPTNYDYFNKTDASYASTHVRKSLSVNLPACRGEKYQIASEGSNEPEQDVLPNSIITGARSLEDIGLSEDDVVRSMDDYYTNCNAAISQNGVGSFTYVNVLDNEEMFRQWEKAYTTNEYKEKYLQSAMEEAGARQCQLSLEYEQLSDGRFVITHKYVLR